MINAPVLPSTTLQDLHGVYALIALIKDPDAAQARLAQIVEAQQKVEAAQAAAVMDRKAAEDTQRRAEQLAGDAARLAAETAAQKATLDAAHAARMDALSSEHASKLADVDAKLNAAMRRETEVSYREKAHGDRVASQNTDLDAAWAKHKQAAAEFEKTSAAASKELDRRAMELVRREADAAVAQQAIEQMMAESETLRNLVNQKRTPAP